MALAWTLKTPDNATLSDPGYHQLEGPKRPQSAVLCGYAVGPVAPPLSLEVGENLGKRRSSRFPHCLTLRLPWLG